MSFQPGDELAHYEIVEPIGKGGMGEVYRARDGKLGRDVAIKVLPDEFAQNEERLRRFQREAKVLASLNHPNIAAIYGLEHTEDTHYLVLELVPGETLAERIARGPIPLDEALDIAKKIAAALEQAHEQGIVHRDLKPANVKLTPDDDVKVLDFGLAKALAEEAQEADSSMSPTITRDATRVGVILGTAAYMSPEQAKGKQVDKRADIWAFGVVLYEMLTGERAFHGEDVSDTLAAVLRAEPKWEALPASAPTPVRALLRRCLVKNPRERLRDIGDAALFTEASAGVGSPAPSSQSRLFWLVTIAAITVAAFASLLAFGGGDVQPPAPTHLSIALPADHPLVFSSTSQYSMNSNVAISRDGARVAFSARAAETTRLFVRELDANTVPPIAGTEGGLAPLFSLDGNSLVYFHRASERLMKVAIDRGPPVAWIESGFSMGLSWDDDETLLVGRYPDIGIWMFLPASGELERVTAPEGDNWHYWPHRLPGRNAVLFTANKGAQGRDVDVLDVSSGERRVVARNATTPKYVPTGHLVFARDETLFAAPFDIDTLEVTGEIVPVIENLAVHRFGGAHYGFSDNGTLVYVPSPAVVDDSGAVVIVDREGNEQLLAGIRSPLGGPRWSPDGRHIALSRDQDIWLYDTQRNVESRLTTESSSDQSPVWSPDGKHLVFSSTREGPFRLYLKSVESTAPPSPVAPSEYWQFAGDWSEDGAHIVFNEENSSTGHDLWIYSVEEGAAHPFLVTEFNESAGAFSPDGRWIAYASDESGENEIYVRAVDAPGGRAVQVSTMGAREPLWSPAGDEIFYRDGDRMMVVRISTSPTVTVGTPEVLFEGAYRFGEGVDTAPHYDVTADGKRFLMVREEVVSLVTEIRVVLDWFEELKRLVPVDD